MESTTNTRLPVTPDASARERLDELLDDELAYDPVARNGFINHTAMAMVAGWRLGATSEDLERWFHHDTTSDFLMAREIPANLNELREEVSADGPRAMVERHAEDFLSSPVTQLFHAPIRLEYGLDVSHAGQVANGVHNWVTHAETPNPLPETNGAEPFSEVARRIAVDPAMARIGFGDHGEVAGQEWFASQFATADLSGPELIDEVAGVAAAAHVAGNNIGSLHLVTGTRAVRVIMDWLDDDTAGQLARHTATAVATTLFFAGGPLPTGARLDELRATELPDWHEISRRAIASGDPHVVKLAYSAMVDQEISGDRLYQWLAARQARALTTG